MGKYSSSQSKQRHSKKCLSKHVVRNWLLDYGFRDNVLKETVYTLQTDQIVLKEMQKHLGYVQMDVVPLVGEVLVWPGGESPSLSIN